MEKLISIDRSGIAFAQLVRKNHFNMPFTYLIYMLHVACVAIPYLRMGQRSLIKFCSAVEGLNDLIIMWCTFLAFSLSYAKAIDSDAYSFC